MEASRYIQKKKQEYITQWTRAEGEVLKREGGRYTKQFKLQLGYRGTEGEEKHASG